MYGEVQTAEWLTPSMVRITFGGPGLDGFEPSKYTDQYINGRFLPDGSALTVPLDPAAVEALEPADRPRSRKYTVRRWDEQTRLLTVDFVAHGDVGYAGQWAQHAQPGDRLEIQGPGGGYLPDPDAAWYLFAGDESALPAIAASLEALPDDAQCLTFVVVDSPEHQVELRSAPGFTTTWLHRESSPNPETLLLDAIVALDFADGPVDVFVHGEAGETRSIRKHLIADRGLVWDDMSISPYWRRGKTDEAWREIKRSWMQAEAAELRN